MTPFNFGTVKFWDAKKGYGFLIIEGANDLYVSREELAPGINRLQPMERVRFRASFHRGMNRAMAIDVRPAPSVSECIQSMQALRRQIDHKIPNANAQLTELRFLLDEIQKLAVNEVA